MIRLINRLVNSLRIQKNPDKAKIADKLAPFESSRAPIISVEHIQNVTREDEGDADDALNDFMESLRKV